MEYGMEYVVGVIIILVAFFARSVIISRAKLRSINIGIYFIHDCYDELNLDLILITDALEHSIPNPILNIGMMIQNKSFTREQLRIDTTHILRDGLIHMAAYSDDKAYSDALSKVEVYIDKYKM